MSSPVFETQLRPDPAIRRWLLYASGLFAIAGLILISNIMWPASWRVLLAVMWVTDCGWEASTLIRGAGRVHCLILDSDGSVVVHDSEGQAQTVTLLSGSMVLGRLAWLRVGFDDGARYGELLVGKRDRCENWHRLQIIWHLSRDAFGHLPRP